MHRLCNPENGDRYLGWAPDKSAVAQWSEHHPHKVQGAGSSPACATNYGDRTDRSLLCEGGPCRFEPCSPCQTLCPADGCVASNHVSLGVRLPQRVPTSMVLPIEAGRPDPYPMLGDESPGAKCPCSTEGRAVWTATSLENWAGGNADGSTPCPSSKHGRCS